MTALNDFIQHETSMPTYPGACCRMVDKWITEATGQSALGRFGRDFENEGDVQEWLAEPGGLAVAVNRVMRTCGFAKTKEPLPGDVGLVIKEGKTLCMAILTNNGWLVRDDRGFSVVPSFWKAWAIR